MANRIGTALGGQAAPHWLGTFHRLGARQLRLAPEVAALRPDFDILDAYDSRQMIKRIMKALNLACDEDAGGGRDPVKAISNKISSLKDRLMTPEAATAQTDSAVAAASRRGDPIDGQVFRNAAKVYALYQQRLSEANAADFGDLLLWPTLAMIKEESYRRQWAGRFDAVLADEYQDVNHAQHHWLKAIASLCRRIFAVGDDDQSIYGWRGADVSLIRRFTRDFPDAAEVRLEENFRSTGHILAAANAVIAGDKNRLGKTLFTSLGAGHPIAIATFRDSEGEASGLAGALLARRAEGAAWSDMAVLYRTNALSRAFEEVLIARQDPLRDRWRCRLLRPHRDQDRARLPSSLGFPRRSAVGRGFPARHQRAAARLRPEGARDRRGGGVVEERLASYRSRNCPSSSESPRRGIDLGRSSPLHRQGSRPLDRRSALPAR